MAPLMVTSAPVVAAEPHRAMPVNSAFAPLFPSISIDSWKRELFITYTVKVEPRTQYTDAALTPPVRTI